ncbi:MAG: TonB-dependent receptor [Chitinophagales bacterium]|nr:TonB-dependent receptor [Chitinophagales bacterium]
MKKLFLILSVFFTLQHLSAQNTIRAIVKSVAEEDGEAEPLIGAIGHVADTTLSGVADSTGLLIIESIPNGECLIEISYTGYFKKKIKVKFPLPDNSLPIELELQSQAEELEEIIVTSTRNYQKPEYLPTRVEVITEEDVEERSHDKPSDVSHVLREQPGVQVQRTSATAGTMGIRLQGLNSRYTQILKDGFPIFGGFSNVIGITQIPPLDLRQVEIIKGPASTLYGGDAIAGVINLVSKTPTEAPVYDLMFNGETANAYDAGVYASQKIKWFAFSVMGAYRYQFAKDWNHDHFTETPKLQRYSASPQLFFDLSKHAKLNIGGNYTHEYRLGGTTEYIAGKADTTYSYFERNTSDHISTNFKFEYDFEKAGKLTAKNAFNFFDRELKIPYYFFKGKQLASASELNYRFIYKKHDVVIGVDYRTDKFTEGADSALTGRGYNYQTVGGFVQYIFNYSDKTTLEGGFRIDYSNVYKVYPLPHIAIRQKWNEVFSTRFNIGMGYKLPTIFQDESEQARFVQVQGISTAVKPEISLGGTIDLKIKLPNFNGLQVTISQLYFLTQIFRPLVVKEAIDSTVSMLDPVQTSYINANGYRRSGGVETGVAFAYRWISASVVYTYTDNNQRINGVRSIAPLTSKHIVSFLAGYEIKNFSIGLDVYYYSPVKLSDGRVGRHIWEVGVNAQYSFKYILLFANFENIADIRQTSFSPVVYPNPTYAHPRFSEIYAPLEGRLFNMGFKLRLGAFAKKNKGKDSGVERLKRKDD